MIRHAKSILFFLATIALHSICANESTDPLFYIVIPSYNNANWYRKNLDSVFVQDYTNYHVIYIDDVSPDGTADLVQGYIQENNLQDKITLHKNKIRKGALANLYFAIHESPDNAIIVTLDGDDWFAHEQVLSRLAQEYRNPEIWLTYGQYTHPWGGLGCPRPIPQDVIDANAYRSGPLLASHLRTFYAWLFKSIRLEDLLYEGAFFPMTWDWAMMFPMLEMSGGRFTYIEDILYVYNTNNPINDSKVDEPFQISLSSMIQQKKAYTSLQKPVDISLHTTRPISYVHIDLAQNEKNIHELLQEEKNKGVEYLIFTDGALPDYAQKNLLEQMKQLEQTQAQLGVVAIIKDRIVRNNITKDHCTPLYDTVYTFQCGWDPKVRITHIHGVIVSLERCLDKQNVLSQCKTIEVLLDLFQDYYPDYAGLLFITKEM